jgi:hypothetical protein
VVVMREELVAQCNRRRIRSVKIGEVACVITASVVLHPGNPATSLSMPRNAADPRLAVDLRPDSVFGVLLVGHHSKMRRIHASRDMADVVQVMPYWDRADEEFVRDAVCWAKLPFNAEVSVAGRSDRTSPQPATVRTARSVDTPPEPIFKG